MLFTFKLFYAFNAFMLFMHFTLKIVNVFYAFMNLKINLEINFKKHRLKCLVMLKFKKEYESIRLNALFKKSI